MHCVPIFAVHYVKRVTGTVMYYNIDYCVLYLSSVFYVCDD